MDIFGQNTSTSAFAINGDGRADEERDLNGDERDLLKEFEENDKELEDIAG
jgi:hypothetical protein